MHTVAKELPEGWAMMSLALPGLCVADTANSRTQQQIWCKLTLRHTFFDLPHPWANNWSSTFFASALVHARVIVYRSH